MGLQESFPYIRIKILENILRRCISYTSTMLNSTSTFRLSLLSVENVNFSVILWFVVNGDDDKSVTLFFSVEISVYW